MKFETVLKDIQQQIKIDLVKKGVPTWNLNYDTSQGAIEKSPSGILFAIRHVNHGIVNAFKNVSGPQRLDLDYERVIVLVAYYYMITNKQVDNLNDEESLLDFCLDLTDHIVQLLIEKNHDYGSSYFKVARELGINFSFSVRFLDKENRLEQFQKLLEAKDRFKVKDESVTDTLRDLLGYYLLYLVTVKSIQSEVE